MGLDTFHRIDITVGAKDGEQRFVTVAGGGWPPVN